MEPIARTRLNAALAGFKGRTAYIHLEVNPGAVLRNIPVRVAETFAVGDRLFRAAIRSEEGGWIRVEGLTDMEEPRAGQLLLAGHDDSGRITAALQLCLQPFDFEGSGGKSL